MSQPTRTRNCSRVKNDSDIRPSSKRICIPIEQEEYARILPCAPSFRAYLDAMITKHPELFPSRIESGYRLHDILPPSKKMPDIRLRRIALVSSKEVYTIAPSFLLPYMTGFTDEVEKALFLRRFGVPFWALTYVFGRNDMYWQRQEQRLGNNHLVGTTVKQAANLPEDVLADEKHTKLNGERVYVATTVGDDCVLGASVTLNADAESLTEAYGHFKTEAQQLDQDYQPKTVNTDGWKPTQTAWRALFPAVQIILCFLHCFLRIRDRCKRMKDRFDDICRQVWEAYHAPDKNQFLDKLHQFSNWANRTLPQGTGLEAIRKLTGQATVLAQAYDHPSAYRTSNMMDRHMEPMSRCLESARYYHGHLITAERSIRAWALMHNFLPYAPRAKVAKQYHSPAHKLNGFVYHHNWLQNLMVAASMGGTRP